MVYLMGLCAVFLGDVHIAEMTQCSLLFYSLISPSDIGMAGSR